MHARAVPVVVLSLMLGHSLFAADPKPKAGPPAPVPPPAWVAERGYGLWTEGMMVKLLPSTRPAEYARQPSVSLALAGREYESFQIGILPVAEAGLKNVRVEFTDLTGEGNILKSRNLRWYRVGFILSNKDRIPDMLLPVPAFDAERDRTHVVVITLHSPADQPPGVYRGTATVCADGVAPTAISLTAEVFPFALPEGPGNCRTAFALQRARAFDPGEFRLYADCMLDHRLNPDDIYSNTFPAVADLEHYYERGLNCFTICKCGNPNAEIAKWLDELGRSPHGAQIRKCAIFYGWDEKGKATWPAMQARFKSLEEAFPDIPRNTTAHLYQGWDGKDPVDAMKEYCVDQICPWIHPGYPKFYDYEVGEKLRRAGLEQWAYNINFQTHYPLLQPRATFWQMFFLKADGWLYYCVNGWEKESKKIDPAAGDKPDYKPSAPNSQAELLYRGVNGPITTLRLSNIRDGIEDFEYLTLLARKAGDVEVAREVCERVCWEVLKWTDDPARIEATRREMARWIAQPFLAASPVPGHRAGNVALDARLTWKCDQPAAVHGFDLYFGTNAKAVSAATPKSPEYRGRLKDATFTPKGLQNGATYFWRVDEVTEKAVFAGYVWRFSTLPAPSAPDAKR